jgi:hypothetical protein
MNRIILGTGYAAPSENSKSIVLESRYGEILELSNLDDIDCVRVRLIAEVLE